MESIKMTSFADAVVTTTKSKKTTTTNGMRARVTTANNCVDFFYKVGASRGRDVTEMFLKAFQENPELALRIVLWLRDIRGGAGERQLFRQLLKYIEQHVGTIFTKEELIAVMNKVPEVGRWDDLFDMQESFSRERVFDMISVGLDVGDGLLGKWLPREKSANKSFAVAVMQHLGLTPRQYRKLLVKLTTVVETPMCANQWDTINFSHVPSKAATLYKRAFHRHTKESGSYQNYIDSLVAKDGTVKVNAEAIFPHEVLKDITNSGYHNPSSQELSLIQAQWEALPDFMDGQSVMAMVDTSGSMWSSSIPGTKMTAANVAVALGMYCADKGKGKFKDVFVNFNSSPSIQVLTGGIVEKIQQFVNTPWGGSTNIEAAFKAVLNLGVKSKLKEEEMPKILLILSDMQFDRCARDPDDSMLSMLKQQYNDAGYELPKIVFWNLCAHDNVPVKFNKSGTALVSGFSPAILKSILSDKLENFTPENVMIETVMAERYDLGL